MKPERVDLWCRDLGISGDAKKLLILFADRGEATMEEMIEYLHGDKEDGGPVTADRGVRVTLSRLRKLLAGRAEISHRSLWELKLVGIKKDAD